MIGNSSQHQQERQGRLARSIRKTLNSFQSFHPCLSVFICGFVLLFSSATASAQDWFRPGTGLGVSKARVAVADFAAKDTPSQPLATLFSDVVRADLHYSGILELVSKSFYPLQSPATPSEV